MSVYAKDHPSWVEQALQSVLSNTVKPAEVIITVDGPVGPEIEEVLHKFAVQYSEIKCYALTENGGLGPALAYGLQRCSHELVARMDADDLSLPQRFEKQLAYFAIHPDTAVLGGYIQEIDAVSGQPIAVREVPQTDKQIKQFLKIRCPFNHMSVMLRKSAVLSAGNYQLFHLLEDYYLWARLCAQGALFGNLRDILLNVRVNKAMYGRRGGWKYFKSNLAMSRKLRELGIISWPVHVFNVITRFGVQVMMPNKIRGWFYRKALR